MNRIYRSIWNGETGTFVAASENAKSNGKKSSSGATAVAGRARFALQGLAASVMLALGLNVYALPTGGVVSAGSANIAGSTGKTTITQSSQNVAINWQSFNIGQTEAVQFVQPNASSIALNRVLGSDPSSILGSLSANGKVFLVNPNGILFGQGAQVNVAGLVASTRNITDSDFMAGIYKFSGSGGGTIVNQGSIKADGGYVALLGASVSNEGVISARLGTVALAAGNAFTLDVAGDGLLNVVVNDGAVNALVKNGGMIQADGGQVLLTAQAAGNLLQSVVNNTGIIQAQTVENHNGTIRLLADMQSGTVNISGTLDASGTGAGQTGGNVTATAQHVGLFGGHINASGDAGGGTVLIGGGYQGNNPAVQNASATYMSPDSTITADAFTIGNGGTVVLWSTDSTRAYGGITARGGAQGGDGGLIETSGHWLDVAGISINAGASNGTSGTWLLDPADITISNAPVTIGATNIGGVFAPDPGIGSATIFVNDVINALQAGGGTNVTITTINRGVSGTPSAVAPNSGLGDITLSLGVALTWGTPAKPATLTLLAGGNTNINGTITLGDGNLVVCCGRDINVSGTITNAGGGGSVFLSAGHDINLLAGGTITTTVGNVTMCAGHDINLTGKLTMTSAGTGALAGGLAGGLVLSAGNAATGPGLAGGGGTVNILAVGAGRPVVTMASATPFAVTISYNPTSYVAPHDYSGEIIINTPTIALTQFMLVFPGGANKTFDGNTVATFTSLQGSPAGVTLNPGGTANFANAGPGVNIPITYSGLTLAPRAVQPGGAGINFALPTGCCGAATITTGTIIAAVAVVPPLGALVPIPGALVPAAGALPLVLASVGANIPGQLAGMNLSVLNEGIRMPPVLVAQRQAVEVPPPVQAVPPVEVRSEVPPPVYVPPVRPRKPDRN